ncbi:MAG: NEW3 domain-containing protein [Gemmatimonadota bacterium]|nr:NEW3 domain-containing protein [Gemmatimonadota bacterium]
MTYRRYRRILIAAAAMAALPASLAGGQGLSVAARSLAGMHADPGSTVSLVYSVANSSLDALSVIPAIGLPIGWTAVMGTSRFSVGGGESEIWVVGVVVPVQADAGDYSIKVSARAAGTGAVLLASSVTVTVARKRGVSLLTVDRPIYAIGGARYGISYQLRNLGNGAAKVRVAAVSSQHSTITMEASSLDLAPNERRTVKVQVSTLGTNREATEDLVELRATDVADENVFATASATVTIVQRPGTSDPLTTVPATLLLRASQGRGGVAPFEFAGGGRITENRSEEIEFTFRGAPGVNSPLGERRESRVELRGTNFRARMGDNYFILSPLTGGGQLGYGAGLELFNGPISGGGYTERFRAIPGGEAERGAFIRFSLRSPVGRSQVSINAVDRTGSASAGRVFSSAISLAPRDAMLIDGEYAASSSAAGTGRALSLRVSGGSTVHYDLAHVGGDARFAGPTRGAANDYGALSARISSVLQLNLSANRSGFVARSDSGAAVAAFRSATIGARLADRLSVEVTSMTPGAGTRQLSAAQRFLKARYDRSFGLGGLWAGVETGRRTPSTAGGFYHDLTFGANINANRASLSIFGDVYDGGAIAHGPDASTSFGGNARVRLPGSNSLSLLGYTSRYTGLGAVRYSQVDTRLTHDFGSGGNLSLRARIAAPVSVDAPGQKLVYLELALPLHLPVGRSRPPGRVSGLVVDASGKGVGGALIRVGPLAGVTDADGRVTVAGLLPGEYRVSLSSDASIANAVLSGDAIVRIDSSRRAAANFTLAVTPASRILGRVRRFASARTSLVGEPDSLVDAGPVEGVTLALVGARDTLHRTTGQDGKFSFDEIPRGSWTIVVEGDAPSSFSYERRRVNLVAESGQNSEIDFRLVPRQKRVQIIAGNSTAAVPGVIGQSERK